MSVFDNHTDRDLIRRAEDEPRDSLTYALAERLEMRLRDLQDATLTVPVNPQQLELFPTNGDMT
jgi:hypothetical protein